MTLKVPQALVEITGPLPTGNELLGRVTIEPSTNNIGDVDVLTEPSGSGVYATATHTTLGVTAASQAALAANINRLYAMFINDSDAVIYLKIGAAAVVNEGIRLNANGGSYEMSKKAGNLNTGGINAITAVATKVLLILEGV